MVAEEARQRRVTRRRDDGREGRRVRDAICAERVEADARAEAGEAERERVRDDEVERVVLVDVLGRRHRDGHARRVGSPGAGLC